MGEVRPGIPVDLAIALRDRLALVGAVETGTYLGDSAVLLGQSFVQVWTIELAEALWQQAREKHVTATNVHFMHGASQNVLAEVAGKLTGPALYWLDGHWSGGATAGSDNECPVLEEIEAIDATPNAAESAILIDDARLFTAPPPPPHKKEQWPDLMEVCDSLRKNHDRYVTVLQDIIVAVPRSARGVVEDWGMAPAAVALQPQLGLLRRLIGA